MSVESSFAGGPGRSPGRRVRGIEYRRARTTRVDSGVPTWARYVGRVGALAIALGVGSAVGSLPMAFADGTGGLVRD